MVDPLSVLFIKTYVFRFLEAYPPILLIFLASVMTNTVAEYVLLAVGQVVLYLRLMFTQRSPAL